MEESNLDRRGLSTFPRATKADKEEAAAGEFAIGSGEETREPGEGGSWVVARILVGCCGLLFACRHATVLCTPFCGCWFAAPQLGWLSFAV